ncbi:MAG: hypothetical protein ACE5HV_09555 [Acidobacteriota bacterium]
MNPAILLKIFGLIALAIMAVALWMAWYARRAVAQHRKQVRKIVEEMKTAIDKQDQHP